MVFTAKFTDVQLSPCPRGPSETVYRPMPVPLCNRDSVADASGRARFFCARESWSCGLVGTRSRLRWATSFYYYYVFFLFGVRFSLSESGAIGRWTNTRLKRETETERTREKKIVLFFAAPGARGLRARVVSRTRPDRTKNESCMESLQKIRESATHSAGAVRINLHTICTRTAATTEQNFELGRPLAFDVLTLLYTYFVRMQPFTVRFSANTTARKITLTLYEPKRLGVQVSDSSVTRIFGRGRVG